MHPTKKPRNRLTPLSVKMLRYSVYILVFFLTASCTIEGGFVFDYDVTIYNKLDEDIYVIDPDPNLVEVALDDRTYKLEPDESIWLSWGEWNSNSHVEIELSDRTCFVEVHEGFHAYVNIDDDWIDTYCSD